MVFACCVLHWFQRGWRWIVNTFQVWGELSILYDSDCFGHCSSQVGEVLASRDVVGRSGGLDVCQTPFAGPLYDEPPSTSHTPRSVKRGCLQWWLCGPMNLGSNMVWTVARTCRTSLVSGFQMINFMWEKKQTHNYIYMDPLLELNMLASSYLHL